MSKKKIESTLSKRTANEMNDTANLIKTQEQHEQLKMLCAHELGVTPESIEIGLIADIGNGKYRIKIMHRHICLYAMIYDGKNIIEYNRLIYGFGRI